MNNQYPDNWFSFYWFKYSTLSTYSWENQFFLYLLILIPILFLVKIFLSKKNRLDVSIPKYELKTNHISLLRLLPKLLIAICFTLLIISISRPQKSNEKVERWTDGIDIMLVIDISESMQIEDFKPNRLESAKEVAKKFVNGRPMTSNQRFLLYLIFASLRPANTPMADPTIEHQNEVLIKGTTSEF